MVYYQYLCGGLFFCAPKMRADARLSRHGMAGRASARGRYKTEKFRRCRSKMRVKVTLACSECKQRNYDTKKNKKNDPDRLEMKKYCRFCRKHTLHRETK